MLTVVAEPRSSPASNRGGRATRGKIKRPSHLAESFRKGRRGSKGSIEDSQDGENGDAMDVDIQENLVGSGTRRSVRKRQS